MRLNPFRRTRVVVYVDAFNLYYGARDQCGRGRTGWRWIDLYGLSESLIENALWRRPVISKLVYCTAMRTNEGKPDSLVDQEAYVKAVMSDKRSQVLLGKYAPKTGKGIVIRKKTGGKHERIISPGKSNIPSWLPAAEVRGQDGREQLMVHFTSFEEKGSDVNLASQLMIDVAGGKFDAAIIISNDGDLRYPIEIARGKVMVGLVNPSSRPTAEALKARSSSGRRGHWWRRLSPEDFRTHQLPDVHNDHKKPVDW
ncbi:NYN domain-containing protein [Herbiconiux solani]|uniref:NYN domain-containing protein n=1 Tax=Herbiconiux solani TaxID=661329 RepID=UPI000A004E13|nr:NYN domain-containing protein [Herbiconiux solani]